MASDSSIQWTDSVWNPVRGCRIVSPGCQNCYAMKMAHRFSGEGRPYEGLTRLTIRGPEWTGEVRTVPDALEVPLHWRKPRKVFVNSMSDLFHEDVPDYFMDEVFAVMLLSPRHTFQVLTKRAERMAAYFATPDLYERVLRAADELRSKHAGLSSVPISNPRTHPAPWIWWGVSVEDQRRADERIPHLLRSPAAVRFLSMEPLLGPVDLRRWLPRCGTWGGAEGIEPEPINWVIIGGESGARARPMHPYWIRNIIEQCRGAAVPVFVKQLGAWLPRLWTEKPPTGDKWGTLEANGEFWSTGTPWNGRQFEDSPVGEVLMRHVGGHNSDPEEWPADLRVREWPEVKHG